MRNLKKFLALVLAMVMAMSLMVSVNAAVVNPDNATNKYGDGTQVLDEFKEAVDVLSGMGVFKGDEVGFRPADTITRGEVAAIIYRLVTGDVDDNRAPIYSGWGNFTDVASTEWFAPYVGYLANGLIVKGTSATTYEPYAPVTGYEALAMILRAVGYDKNGEFTGSGWTIEVSRIATERNMLKNINKTNYSNLNDYARRDLVAELLFQAAQLKTVIYTPAFGYQTGTVTSGVSSNNTDSLGWTYFGLVSNTGVVVGNQSTGEGSTLIAMTGEQNDTSNIARMSYAYGDSTSYNTKTGLDMFGHAIKVWYNGKMGFNRTTYAWYDRATLVKTVLTSDSQGDGGNTITGGTNANPLGDAARAAGFTLYQGNAYTSDRYGRIDTLTGRTNVAVELDTVSNMGTAESPSELYALISNRGTELDVVISLAAELAEITRHDTTSTVQSLQLGDKLGATGIDSKFGESNMTPTDYQPAGRIRMNSLVENSETALGSIVTAWEVVGTNRNDIRWVSTGAKDPGTNIGADRNGVDHLGYLADNATTPGMQADDDLRNTANTNLNYYKLNKISNKITAKISHYNDGKLVLTNGTTYDFTFLPIINNVVEKPRNDYEFNTGDYDIYLDEFGRFVYWTQSHPTSFLYGTYGDYSLGELGSGDLAYAVTGVLWSAEKSINNALKTLDNHRLTGSIYENMPISKKNLGGNAGGSGGNNWGGNEIVGGKYMGYMLDGNGNFTTKNPDYMTANSGFEFDKTNVNAGFVDADDDAYGKVLITKNTKFIVVSGTGTSTLKVDVYNGMAELLGNASTVAMNVGAMETFGQMGNATGLTTPKHSVYYQLTTDAYNNVEHNWNVGTNMIQTMILPKEALTWEGGSNRYFTNAVNHDGFVLAGTNGDDTIQRFTFWQNGAKAGSFWIDTDYNGDNLHTYSNIIDDTTATTKGEFFNLTQIREVNGTPIYKAVKVVAAEHGTSGSGDYAHGCNTALDYKYTAVNNTFTAMIGGKIFNVTNAKVVEVHGGTKAHNEIKSVEDINRAISIGYQVTVAIESNGVNVQNIYVTNLEPSNYNP